MMRASRGQLGKIGVLMGGVSTERGISLQSGTAVYEALKSSTENAVPLDITTDDKEQVASLIRDAGIAVAFIALHGRFGEDGAIQEILESLHIPYTGSGVMASRLAMDKIESRRIFEQNGLRVPQSFVIHREGKNQESTAEKLKSLSFPVVVKPATHGSSIGVSILNDGIQTGRAIAEAFQYDERVIVEEYISGREVTVGIVDDKPLPVIEIIPKHRFFDFQAKYTKGETEYVVPAVLSERRAALVQEAGAKAHGLLGCRHFSRVDIILRENTPVVLEVNTIPGFTATSLLPKAAKVLSVDFVSLCLHLVRLAYGKEEEKQT